MKSPKLKIKVWKAKDGYRWNFKRCGRIVAESGEGYKRHAACLKTLNHLLEAIQASNYEFALPQK